MILSSKLLEYLFQMATGENGVGSKQREREREKERCRLTEWEKDHWRDLSNSVGCKRPLVKRKPEYFKQIRWMEQKPRQLNGILNLGWASNSLRSVLWLSFSWRCISTHHFLALITGQHLQGSWARVFSYTCLEKTPMTSTSASAGFPPKWSGPFSQHFISFVT